MPNRCTAFGCKSGDYKHTDKNRPKITFHSYPTDKELIAKWIKANPREGFEPSKHSRLCSLHFQPTDFVDVSKDSNGTRKKLQPEKPLLLRYLKKDAVPSIFPNAPSYLSCEGTTQRSSKKATLYKLYMTQVRSGVGRGAAGLAGRVYPCALSHAILLTVAITIVTK